MAPFGERRGSIRRFLSESRQEFGRVTWPDAREVRAYALVVAMTVVAVGTFVFALDDLLGRLALWLFGGGIRSVF